ncbi:MAG: hypothetical protein U9P90_03240 [Patescibacteria group bacterium]|nr:hypothetical protein [Patescibacteria group bacterium]
MDKKTLKQLEEKLLKEKEKVEKKLKAFAKQNPRNKDDFNAKFPQLGDKEDENANEVALYSDNLTLERTLEKILQDIKKSLGRIKRGTYGKCKYCKKMIDSKRLLARPASSACVACKKALTQER